MKMNMEHCWNVTDRGRPKYWEKNLSQFQFVHYKSHLILELEVKEKYQIEITNRFAALENLDVDEDVNKAWENITGNIKTSAKASLGLHKWKQQKPWFDTEC